MQEGRVLTIRIRIVEPEASKAIWESITKDTLASGCKVSAIADGDLFDERDKYEAIAKKAMEEHWGDYPADLPETLTTKCGKIFHWHPFDVYSTHHDNFDVGEWYTDIEEVRSKYEIISEE